LCKSGYNKLNQVISKGVLMDGIIVLSSWEDRFWAWLIDVLLMGLLWHTILIFLNIEAFGLSGAFC
jgi:hypothetical protein